MSAEPSSPAYDQHYYENYCSEQGGVPYGRGQHWLDFFGRIAERVVADLSPRTVLDAGCAMGLLVEALRDKGVEAFGLDISQYAIDNVREDIQPFCRQGSILDPFGRRYDLITCIETVEHLTPDQGIRAVANICSSTDDVLFSSTPHHFKEVTHLTVRPAEYWAELFARHGLYHDVDYEPSTYLSPWAVRFRRAESPPRALAAYERSLTRARTESVELRQLAQEQQSRIARLESDVVNLNRELRHLRESPSVALVERWATRAKWLFPSSSARGQMVRRLVRGDKRQ
ncbi:MAG TPA: methyltransferase domain-containing protein [Candidatus Acidoferrales bacterium]|nr:methyltransferase domain-containing protein [Candidatus Acidoferrales bacterium]